MKPLTKIHFLNKEGELVFSFGTSFLSPREVVLFEEKRGRRVSVEGSDVFVKFQQRGEG